MLNLNYKQQKKLIIISFTIIPLVLLLMFTYYPALSLVRLSFSSWDGISKTKHWIGIDNYREVFSNIQIFGVFSHNLIYFFAQILQNVVAIPFAVLLNGKIRQRNVFRAILFVPFILNGVANAFMWQYVLDTQNGAVNMLLQNAGLGTFAQNWLGDALLVNWSLAFVMFWKWWGWNMVIYLGALQAISADLYEAATIDGANSIQTFRYITLPHLKSIIELMLFLGLAGTLAVFDLPFLLASKTLMGAADTFVTKTVETAFTFRNYGLSAAMGVVLALITIVLTVIQKKVLSSRGGDA